MIGVSQERRREEVRELTDKPSEIRINNLTAAEVLHDSEGKLSLHCKILQQQSSILLEPRVLMGRAKSAQRHRCFGSLVPLHVSPIPVHRLQIKQIKTNTSKHTPVLFVSDVLVPSGVVVLVVPATAFTNAQTSFIQS